VTTIAPPVRVAVIGVGHFGAYHAEKVANLPRAELVAVADIDRSRAQEIADRHETQAVNDYRDLIGQVDARCA
jgi:predicted dehydrogenase